MGAGAEQKKAPPRQTVSAQRRHMHTLAPVLAHSKTPAGSDPREHWTSEQCPACGQPIHIMRRSDAAGGRDVAVEPHVCTRRRVRA